MASVGHIAVGMAAARIDRAGRQWPLMLFWSALSMLPDADVIGFAFGVDYADAWGHRGATHSLIAAVTVGMTIALFACRFRRPLLRTALLATAVLASHGLLDTLTYGGLGCALLWPFDLTRYSAPWQPIPAAPIGLAFASPRGLQIGLVEALVFSPLVVFALQPHRPFFAGTWSRTPHRPVGVIAVAGFFAAGTLISSATCMALLFPEGDGAIVWRLNPPARAEFLAMGYWAVVLMLVVAATCGTSAAGLWIGARWGHRMAVTVLVINMIGDIANTVFRGDVRTLVGVPIASMMIWYLLSPGVRRQFESGT